MQESSAPGPASTRVQRLHPSLVQSDAQFLEILPRIGDANALYLDCEFHTEGRYHAKLCLVQVAFGSELWALDAQRLDLRPLAAVLQSAAICKVLHDGRQDLPILARATGANQLCRIFDTQIAAAFVGYGGSVGYAALVQQLCGVELDKSLQMSDWSRALSDAQLEYALDDVRYLPKAYAALCESLTNHGRFEWALETCAEAATRALSRPDPDKLYRRVASSSRLSSVQLGILRELAKWRDRVAETLDKPVPSIANDMALKSMAVRPPVHLSGLDAVRGLGVGRNQPWAKQLLEAIALGRTRAEPKTRSVLSREQEACVEGITLLLGVARRYVAAREDIATELLADQAELRALAEWHLLEPEKQVELGVLRGWRQTVIGELLLAVLSGNAAFCVDTNAPSGIKRVEATRI